MDPKEVKKKRTDFSTNQVQVEVYFEDVDYKHICYPNNKITDTGLLKVMELLPKSQQLPTFRFRWHEEEKKVKVDILNVSKIEEEKWEKSKDGYSGHHARRIPDSRGRRIFKSKIAIPGKQIFYGDIFVPLARSLRITEGITFTEEPTVVKKTKNN